jgi:sugar phosphate isomerase/epimerase
MKTSLTRRQLIRSSAAALSCGALLQGAGGKFTKPLGVELYTVRNVIDKDTDTVIRRIAEIGYTEVEPGRAALEKLKPFLHKYKLKPVSCHLEANLVTGGEAPVTLDQAIEEAKGMGVKHLIYPYVAPAKRGDADMMHKFADQMNLAGAKIAHAGMKFGYHNHAFEFGGKEGERTIDVFLKYLDPKLVGFQLDVFWVSVAGNDPVQWINKLKGRVLSIHLKDKIATQPVFYAENVPKETFKEVGSGSLDFPAILRAAAATGVTEFFVEQDQTPADPVDSLAASYKYLRGLSV